MYSIGNPVPKKKKQSKSNNNNNNNFTLYFWLHKIIVYIEIQEAQLELFRDFPQNFFIDKVSFQTRVII